MDKKIVKKIGLKIRKLREAVPLSQETMGNKIGISQSAVCKIESGTVEKVDFELMDKICKLFKVDLQYLLSDDSISQINRENKNSAISIFGNPTVNNNFPENVIETILNNQNQITHLLETQNKLIESIVKNNNH